MPRPNFNLRRLMDKGFLLGPQGFEPWTKGL
jgi:hypothetical protein